MTKFWDRVRCPQCKGEDHTPVNGTRFRCDACGNLFTAQLPIQTPAVPGITAELPEDQLKLMISETSEGAIRFDFGRSIAWFAITKAEALKFAMTILERCGVKIEQRVEQLPGGQPS